MAVRNIKLTVQYDGSKYHGWQIQPGKRTIQSELVEAISNLVGVKIRVHGASRTDAGVSALGQVALFEIDSPIPTENFPKVINGRLPHDIVVTAVEEAPWGFDLISGVTSKLYRYTIYTGKYRPVLQLNQCWHISKKLDADAMNQAAQLLVGKKDFKSFASAADKRQSSIRTIFRCQTTVEDKWIYIDVEGDGFLYNMVRNIVGTLVEVGAGRWKPEKINEILEAKDRTAAGPIAPPQGLCLMWIKY
ncbi:MAG: tRNA pseudouridine(38-40) synthase TruA [Phycisphaerales bacterium]|jgi:tRNA pseudouridine38-40 synthase